MSAIETYFDKKTDEMKKYWYTRCEKLLKKCEKLERESNKLYDEAEKHLSNGNELEWESCLTESIEKEQFASGVRYTLKELGFYDVTK